MFYSKIEIEALAATKYHYNKGNFDHWDGVVRYHIDVDPLIVEVRAHLKNILRYY